MRTAGAPDIATINDKVIHVVPCRNSVSEVPGGRMVLDLCCISLTEADELTQCASASPHNQCSMRAEKALSPPHVGQKCKHNRIG